MRGEAGLELSGVVLMESTGEAMVCSQPYPWPGTSWGSGIGEGTEILSTGVVWLSGLGIVYSI